MSGSRLSEGDPDELIECPFDGAHLLRRKRMQYHIIKCGKNHNRRNFKICPFNYRHVIANEDFSNHLVHCEDRGGVERELLQHQIEEDEDNAGQQRGGYVGIPASSFVPPPAEECWDSDVENVVVDVPTHTQTAVLGLATGELFSSPESDSSSHSPSRHEATSTRVREPPQPRLPTMTAASGSEVFKLATSSNTGATRPRGRGRGIGAVGNVNHASPPKVGKRSSSDNSPSVPEVNGASPKVGASSQVSAPPGFSKVSLGRGRGRSQVFRTDAAQSVSATEAAEEQRKKEKKLKKMLRQIEQLEKKQEAGEKLDDDQMKKLARKEDVLSMLQQFHL